VGTDTSSSGTTAGAGSRTVLALPPAAIETIWPFSSSPPVALHRAVRIRQVGHGGGFRRARQPAGLGELGAALELAVGTEHHCGDGPQVRLRAALEQDRGVGSALPIDMHAGV